MQSSPSTEALTFVGKQGISRECREIVACTVSWIFWQQKAKTKWVARLKKLSKLNEWLQYIEKKIVFYPGSLD